MAAACNADSLRSSTVSIGGLHAHGDHLERAARWSGDSGYSAAFNLNLLVRIDREPGTQVDVESIDAKNDKDRKFGPRKKKSPARGRARLLVRPSLSVTATAGEAKSHETHAEEQRGGGFGDPNAFAELALDEIVTESQRIAGARHHTAL